MRVGPATTTVSFQQGVDGKYSSYPAATLLRFADLVGGGAGHVPAGSLVQSATLELNFEDPGAAFTVHQVLRDWAESDTYTSLVDGMAVDGVDAAAAAIAVSADYGEGWCSFDTSAAVTAWLADSTSNHGLLFQPEAGSTNGNDIASSESTTPPKLTIRYLPSDVPDDGIDDPNEPQSVSSVTAAEQYFIYALNRARHDPVAYPLESAVSVDLASVTPRPPLAVNAALTEASGYKSSDMAKSDGGLPLE